MEEVPLLGGNTHDAVVRVGDTVRRPTGPWTPAVHRLLRYLESRGFAPAPRVIGIDERGRENLSFVPGETMPVEVPSAVADDRALAEIAAIVRAYHDVVADHVLDGTEEWHDDGRDPVGPFELVCHNDLAPWNLVIGPAGELTFVDWDLAAPGRRAWDVAWAVTAFVPLMPWAGLADDVVRRRLGVFRDAYGADRYPVDTLAVAIERCANEAERIERLGATGAAPYARLLAEGHAETWANAAAHITEREPSWRP